MEILLQKNLFKNYTVEPRYNGIERTEKKVPLNRGFHNIEISFEGFLVEGTKNFFHKTRFPLNRGSTV